jgi:hypothetical protein
MSVVVGVDMCDVLDVHALFRCPRHSGEVCVLLFHLRAEHVSEGTCPSYRPERIGQSSSQ